MRYERQFGFGPLGVTVVFAAYVLGTLFALIVLGDLSDQVGRRKVLAAGGAVRGRPAPRCSSRPPASGCWS